VNGKQLLSRIREMLGDVRDRAARHRPCARALDAGVDACSKAMTLADHHEWVRLAANQLKCGYPLAGDVRGVGIEICGERSAESHSSE
jgi:hypothetical protein